MNSFAARWHDLNKPYWPPWVLDKFPANRIHYTPRSPRLLLTAPHAVRHQRFDAVKAADAATGGLCALLGELTSASTLIAASPVSEWRDWASRDDAVQKGAFVIDIHGMSDTHRTQLCIGCGPLPSHEVVASRLTA